MTGAAGTTIPLRRGAGSRSGLAALLAGGTLIAAASALLALDVARRGVPVLPGGPGQAVAAPQGALQELARWTAIHMTPLCWAGYLLFFHGLLDRLRRGGSGSPVSARPRRFAACFVTSVGVWMFFDWVNFFFIHAWDYHFVAALGMVDGWVSRLVAFGAISPAMFLAAGLFGRLGLRRLRGPRLPAGAGWGCAMILAGVPALAFPFLVRDPVGCLTLWIGVFLVLDPINDALGAPSLISDWREGRFGRTVSLMAGGLFCGFLWELWNYWAAAKWTYDLPFLGALERLRLFEMPLAGFAGFPPFALECWAAFNTILAVAGGPGRRVAEPLPDPDEVL